MRLIRSLFILFVLFVSLIDLDFRPPTSQSGRSLNSDAYGGSAPGRKGGTPIRDQGAKWGCQRRRHVARDFPMIVDSRSIPHFVHFIRFILLFILYVLNNERI